MSLVSIILPTYNRYNLLVEAVQSILAQTVSDWELIVVDDGSTDGSAAWVESLQDARVTLVRRPHSAQPAILRNLGIAQSRATWIAFQDSDDRWRPEKLERQLAYHVTHPEFRWSYTGFKIIDARGNASIDARRKKWVPYRGDIVASLLTLDATIPLPSVIVERNLLEELGGFDEARHWVEDQDLWLRLATRAECGLIDEPLIEVRAHESMTFDRPEVSLAFVQMYRSFAAKATDPALRAIARKNVAAHAVSAANRLMRRHQWMDAWESITTALRLRPLSPFVYRAAARLLWRWLRATSATRPASRE